MQCTDLTAPSCKSSLIPSIDKGRHACQRAFAALFVLLTLTGVSPPAAQKPKNSRKSFADRCEAVLSRRNMSRQGKVRREYFVFPRELTQYGRISARQNRVCPCQLMVVLRQKNNWQNMIFGVDNWAYFRYNKPCRYEWNG